MTVKIPHTSPDCEVNSYSAYFKKYLQNGWDFSVARKKYYQKIHADSSAAYEEYLHNKKPCSWNLAAVFCVVFQSPSHFKTLSSPRKELSSTNKELILLCCSFMNSENIVTLQCLSSNLDDNFLHLKKKILKNFIKKELKGMCIYILLGFIS